ncbi:hypothetical protein DFQ14_101455 [Halopolyspora algeriensis]|uniref:Pyridoxamine 5'-phosphate oxidase N-terminal domain-containing protein n=1 Tax=Halopolyspora algeriensis TaxID=1500506 RepID=A0A368VYU2_9ACTN|nr:pyridoxamine 5'-phosphate oxidase family protein [Halopolyspora algeriensis]RCW47111.1 hypothetical protein DFQ14_101455 [Halopolyspora algeriensis]TQM48198.1 hypothetical protein FHU43_3160 [Halopolyspora algeriensis]
MATWQQFTEQAPDLASSARARFEAHTHHVLATLRRDGSPRVSGTEVQFHGPELTIGSMWGALKARDLQRDGRCAVHAHPTDASMDGGDAKVTARAVEVTEADELDAFREATGPPPGDFHLFRLDLDEVVHTAVDGDHLLIRLWRPGRGVTEFRRQ